MKKTLKKLTPDQDVIKNHKYLGWLSAYLHYPNLWNFNRKSITKGVAIGLFWTFIPIPMQMVAASIFAIILRGNILISVALVWITNPLTIPPIFYACYKLGAWILGVEIVGDFDFSLEYITNTIAIIWQPLVLGSLIVSTTSSFIGYYGVQIFYLLRIYKRGIKKTNYKAR